MNGPIESSHAAGHCIDNGAVPAPPGTDGNCAKLTDSSGSSGPGVSLVNPSSSGSPCQPSNKPMPSETFTLDNGLLRVGGLCVSGLHGQPTPFGPMQLWTKPLADGAVALLLAHRGSNNDPTASVKVDLADLPGVRRGMRMIVRDIWRHKDLGEAEATFTLNALPHDSAFYVLRPIADT